jgi:hypothetical protein
MCTVERFRHLTLPDPDYLIPAELAGRSLLYICLSRKTLDSEYEIRTSQSRLRQADRIIALRRYEQRIRLLWSPDVSSLYHRGAA